MNKPLAIEAPPAEETVAVALVRALVAMGFGPAFGVSGGGIVPIWSALTRSSLRVVHCRHEAGAAFAATEAYFASGRPSAVFTTTGPGIVNALTGVQAARWDGAKLLLLSPATPSPLRGRWAFQESSDRTLPGELFRAGTLFDEAERVESADEFEAILDRLAAGFARPGRFVAHLSLPTDLQASPCSTPRQSPRPAVPGPSLDLGVVDRCARALGEGTFALWVGFGARLAAREVRELAERTGAPVLCSARAKGIFPENHPQFVGVTGLGGHPSAVAQFIRSPPRRALVLGTRLGETTSFYDPDLVPADGFVHVDLDPAVPGAAFPSAPTLAVRAEVGAFLRALLERLPAGPRGGTAPGRLEGPDVHRVEPRADGPVRPEALMDALQRLVVDGSDALLMAEPGNSLLWTTHRLRFAQPGRYRTSMSFSAMGHFAAGVVGAALARGGSAVAVVGDGAMLMLNEVSTAVRHRARAVWVVLNDGEYNMCRQGTRAAGLDHLDTVIPRVDFTQVARGLGAGARRVERESELDGALTEALEARGPFVLDVRIDPDAPAPLSGRVASLARQGVSA